MQKIIIDTDPGLDDAHAIFMALAHPQTEVVALTAVSGNVGLHHTSRNALTILEMANASHIPVYAGGAAPFVLPSVDAAEFHGKDGLGDAGYDSPGGTINPEPAALALIRYANEQPGELTLVALGPLTNIAAALKIDPTLPSKYKKLVSMAGAVTAQGNATPTAEFNVYADPEAAQVVFAAWPDFVLVDWEVTMRHAIDLAHPLRWQELRTLKTDFYKRIMKNYFIYVDSTKRPFYYCADGVAMAVAIEPDIVEETAVHHLDVELNGRLTRGQTVVDWQDQTGLPANAHIVMQVDHGRFLTLMSNALD